MDMNITREDFPRPGEIYRHFKGRLYQITAVARDSETMNELVVYQALYGDYGFYVRPLSMFMSETDHDKYPDAPQKYRFERVLRSSLREEDASKSSDTEGTVQCGPFSGENALNTFLDARTAKEKLNILLSMKESFLKDSVLSAAAQSLDLAETSNDLEERYYDIIRSLNLLIRYEGSRR